MLQSYYLAKILFKMNIPSFHHCEIDKTVKVSSASALSKAKIGRYTYIGARTSITNAEIGSFCSIAGKCGIGGGEHPIERVSTSPVFCKGRNFLHKNFAEIPFETSKKVTIGHDVWIGENVYIRGGISIGTGAIIGAHSVVTHDVEPYTIVAGVPAHEIRKRFDDVTIQKLLESEWWTWEESRIEQYANFFENPQVFLEQLKNMG